MKEEKFRGRVFNFLLYPDNEEHVKALEHLKRNFDVAYILHDKDLKEDADNELKKEHWHVVCRFGKNAIWNTSICKELNIELRFCEKCANINKSLEYLIHYNNPEKAQYNVDEVIGSLKNRLVELIQSEDKTEGEKVTELIEYIYDCDYYLTVTEFSKHCAKSGFWDVYRRSGAIFNKIIEEHNNIYMHS